MSKFTAFLNALLAAKNVPHDRDKAYLAEAADIYDLERRMREIDVRDRNASPELASSLGLR